MFVGGELNAVRPVGYFVLQVFQRICNACETTSKQKKSHPFFRVSTKKSTSRPWQALCHKLHLTNHVGNCWHRAYWDWSSVGEDAADVVKKNRFDFVIMTEKITFRNKFAKLLSLHLHFGWVRGGGWPPNERMLLNLN